MQNCELLFLDGQSDEIANVSYKMPPSVSLKLADASNNSNAVTDLPRSVSYNL